MPERRLSDTTIAGTPPMKAKVRVCEPIQSDSPCVHVASYRCIARRPQRGDEQLRRHHLAGRSVDHLEGRAGVIDEQALAGNVALPHGWRQPRLPGAVELAVAAIAVAVGMDSAMLLPQQLQRHPWSTQLAVDRRPVWLQPRSLAATAGGGKSRLSVSSAKPSGSGQLRPARRARRMPPRRPSRSPQGSRLSCVWTCRRR